VVIHRNQPPDQPQPFPEDRTWGIVIIVASLLYAVLEIAVWLGIFMLVKKAAGTGPNDITPGQVDMIRGVMLFLSVLSLGLGLGNVVVGIGVMSSRRWAFVLGLVLNAINTVAFLAQGAFLGKIALVVYAGTGAYCFLRLFGHIGPKP
jgi:hypothetical protein